MNENKLYYQRITEYLGEREELNHCKSVKNQI